MDTRAAVLDIRRLSAAGDHAAADAACVALIAEAGDDAGMWILRGQVAQAAKKFAKARLHFDRALMLAPEEPKAWLGLARAFSGDALPEASDAARQALALGLSENDAATAHGILAQGKFAAGDRDGGMAELAALLPFYKRLCATPSDERVFAAHAALPSALCAKDARFIEELLSIMYPHAANVAPLSIAPTLTMHEWCATHGAPFKVIDQACDVSVPPASPYSVPTQYRTGATVLAAIPGGGWIPGWDYAIAPDGAVLEDSGYMGIAAAFNFRPHAYFAPAGLVAHTSPAEVVTIDEEALLLSAPADNNIGHWIIDFLTRLMARGQQGLERLKIAIPDGLGRKFSDLLTLFGVKPDETIRCTKDKRYVFRTLYIFRPGPSMPPHPSHAAFLRRKFYGERKPETLGQRTRVFLSRGTVGTRMIVNAAEFEQVLKDESFTSVDLAKISLAEQKELISRAEVLIATMGTDLLALYFAPPDCTVIGIIDDPVHDPLIRQTCGILGMPFQYLLSQPSGTSVQARHSRDLDFVVDCDAFRQRVRALAAAQR